MSSDVLQPANLDGLHVLRHHLDLEVLLGSGLQRVPVKPVRHDGGGAEGRADESPLLVDDLTQDVPALSLVVRDANFGTCAEITSS